MKFIITENQQRTIKEKVIFKILDMQKYNLVEIDNDRIYFVKKIGDEYGEIRYDKSGGWCRISYDLISFLSSITGFQEFEVQELISNWVEHTLQMEVTYNWATENLPGFLVEHTLQMEVTYNGSRRLVASLALNIPNP